MPRTRIKICGIREVETALIAAAAEADAIGLVLVDTSPRCVTVDTARSIVRALPAFVEPVGLFVDQPPDRVLEVARAIGLGTVQLHGREPVADAHRLEPLRVIKALPFGPDAETQLEPWLGCTNLAGILWDAPPSDDQALPGGSGRSFDWHGLATLLGAVEGVPVSILAGGLTPQNVAEAVSAARPYGVDVSSGVESSRGVKDLVLIAAFTAEVRKADKSLDRQST